MSEIPNTSPATSSANVVRRATLPNIVVSQEMIDSVNQGVRERQEQQRRQSVTLPSLTTGEKPMYTQQVIDMAIQCQRMLIPGAEDVNLIGQMMTLKDETISYMWVMSVTNQQLVNWPKFYETTVYYIYKLACKRGQRPIYINHLADVMRARLVQNYPPMVSIRPPMSLKEIVEYYSKWEGGSGEEFQKTRDQVWQTYENVIGEAYQYCKNYQQIQGKPPPSLHFMIKFCILFQKFNKSRTDSFDASVFTRLARHLHHIIPKEYFETVAGQLTTGLRNPQCTVTLR
ncbi:unnamed protein product [Caenorhabditis brenneri]